MSDTTQRVWDRLDDEAEREAEAMVKARKHRSAVHKYGNNGKSVCRESAIWDEGLEEHFSTCHFCGRTLRHDPVKDDDRELINGSHSLYTQSTDICRSCTWLRDALIRTSGPKRRVG